MELKLDKKSSQVSYYFLLFTTILLLLWVGIFKFTPTEAQAIKPLIENHPLTFWMYNFLSIQTVSIIVGITEIFVALLLLLSLKYYSIKKYAGIGVLIIFSMTISYLFTTPNIWKVVDGVPITDFFILKDLAYLGFGISLVLTKKI